MTETTEAYATVRRGGAFLVSCEHATQRVPDGWEWPEADAWLRDTHWAYDLGALDLARELAEALDATLVHSRFSRLIVDPNRPEDSPTLFRDRAEGRAVTLCVDLDEAERERRITRLLRPYHAALDAEIARSPATALVSMHSFTPVYEGNPRTLEVGVLFTRDEPLAKRVAEALGARWNVELNEPYSGHDGLMYAIDRHARAHDRQAIELEVRQDLAVDPAFRAELTAALVEALTPTGAAGS